MSETVLYDKEIREPLFGFLEETFGKVRILEEKRTGQARADVVMILPEEIWGIEIKSDADTYARLAEQVKNYDLYYDRNVVVAGTSHAQHIEEHVPEWWGIITVERDERGEPDFYVLRHPTLNPNRSMLRKIMILWRPELNRLLEENGFPKYREKSKAFVRKKLAECVPDALLNPQISEALFERDYNTIEDEILAYRKEKRSGKKRSSKRRRRLIR